MRYVNKRRAPVPFGLAWLIMHVNHLNFRGISSLSSLSLSDSRSQFTCLRSCWTIQRNACSSQMRRYRHIICWLRRTLCATIYSQWSVHNLKIRRERFLMVLVKYWSIDLKRKQCCNEIIGPTDFLLNAHTPNQTQSILHIEFTDRYKLCISLVTVSNFPLFCRVWFFIRLFSYHFNCVATQKIERKNNNNYVDLELPINCPIGEIDVR